jgi:predicted nucleic acid-binding protein
VIRLLIDTNVVLDVVLGRRPWAADAAALLDAIEKGRAEGHIAGHAVTTVYYIVDKQRGHSVAATAVTDLLQLLTVVPITGDHFQRALGLALPDFEDGVQAAACLGIGADYLVTRNPKDFAGAPVTTRAPGEVLALL